MRKFSVDFTEKFGQNKDFFWYDEKFNYKV